MTTIPDLIIHKVDNTIAQLECDENLNNTIYNLFSAYMPGFRFNPRYKMHVWDGKVRCYSPMTQTLPIGLVRNLISYCQSKNIVYELDGFESFTDIIDKNQMELDINSYITGFDARDYQVNAVYAALTNKIGVLLSCTGSGKSLMIYSILRYLIDHKNKSRLLLIVPSVSLVEQMYADFRDYGWEDLSDYVEMLYAGQKPTYKKPILISTWQSLEKEDKDFFEPYEGVVVDECVSAETLILTPDGEKPIKNLKKNDYVITFNEKTNLFESNKILETHTNHISSKTSKMLQIELQDGTILQVTSNHPIYTTNRGWVRAEDLTLDDDIKTINNIEPSEDDSN